MNINRIAVTLFLLMLNLSAVLAQSETNSIVKEKFHFDKEMEDAIGFAQAIKTGNTLYISGYTSGGDAPTQIKNVYEALQKVLEHYKIGFENVVKENLYTTDIEGIKLHQEDRKKFYKGDYPAATWVEVKQLYDKSFNLEVELIAVIP